MKRRLVLLAGVIVLALLLLPRPYSGRAVPTGDLPPLVTSPAIKHSPSSDLLDLNTATVQQLEKLPGVGPVRAASIVEYRVQNGPFQSVAELAAVEGIGMGVLAQVQEYLFVSP